MRRSHPTLEDYVFTLVKMNLLAPPRPRRNSNRSIPAVLKARYDYDDDDEDEAVDWVHGPHARFRQPRGRP